MASPSPELPIPAPYPAHPEGPERVRPRTGLVAAAMALFWPVGLAALFSAVRAARAEGAGQVDTARVETRASHRRSWIAVVVGACLVVLRATLWSLLAVQISQHGPALLDTLTASSDTSPIREAVPPTDPSSVSWSDLATGDCFLAPSDDSGWEQLTEIELIPCAEEHDVVVIAIHKHDEMAYPGDDAVADAAWDTCLNAYWAYMNREPPQYANVWPWTPTEYGWHDGGATSPCLLVASEPVRGSLRDRPDLVELDPTTGEST